MSRGQNRTEQNKGSIYYFYFRSSQREYFNDLDPRLPILLQLSLLQASQPFDWSNDMDQNEKYNYKTKVKHGILHLDHLLLPTKLKDSWNSWKPCSSFLANHPEIPISYIFIKFNSFQLQEFEGVTKRN
jgi:hypothetical protein